MMQEQLEYLKKYRKAMVDLLQMLFPLECENCERRFVSYRDFIDNTRSDDDSGAMQTIDSNTVSIHRMCSCGKVIDASIINRRDLSRTGVERREKFGEVLNLLQKRGMEREDARQELLKELNGERSPVLQQAGLTVNF